MRRRLASAAWLLALWNSPLAAQEPRPADQRALAALEGARVVSEQGYLRIEKRVQPLARVRSTERFHGQMPWQSTPFARPWILVQHAGGLLELEGSDRRRGSSQQAEFYNGREVQSAREKFDELRAFLEAAELRAEGPEIEWEAIPVAGGGELLLASVEQPTRAPGEDDWFTRRSRVYRGPMQLWIEVDAEGRPLLLEADVAYQAGVRLRRPPAGAAPAGAPAPLGGPTPTTVASFHWSYEWTTERPALEVEVLRAVGRGDLPRLEAVLQEAALDPPRSAALPAPVEAEALDALALEALHALRAPDAIALWAGSVSLALPEGLLDEQRTLEEHAWYDEPGRVRPTELADGELQLLTSSSGAQAWSMGAADTRCLVSSRFDEWPLPERGWRPVELVRLQLEALSAMRDTETHSERRERRPDGGTLLSFRSESLSFRRALFHNGANDHRLRELRLEFELSEAGAIERVLFHADFLAFPEYADVRIEGRRLFEWRPDSSTRVMTQTLELRPEAGEVPSELACALQAADLLGRR